MLDYLLQALGWVLLGAFLSIASVFLVGLGIGVATTEKGRLGRALGRLLVCVGLILFLLFLALLGGILCGIHRFLSSPSFL